MEDLPLTALGLFVLFGANWVLYGCLWLHERFSKGSGAHSAGMDADGITIVQRAGQEGAQGPPPAQRGHGKVLSEPLSRSITSVRAFSRELSRFGAIIILAYLCEHHPPFPHNKKVHDMDMFWCMALGLFVMSVLNVRKSKGGDVLNREQTEEWKGWMQFMFLMYHYFSAHEVYNSIRVFITAYVWMTGFGNFSFFYLKGDYSAVRLLQMLWRLNFLVTFLCMVMGNHYILYYICPLHTFYFLVVYAIMSPWRSANYTKYGIRYKLLIAGLAIFLIWDADVELFDKVFFFLDRKKIIGAGFGTMWEWYFRTSLDHWSTFLGMIFALNYPSTSLWVKKVEAMPARRQWIIKGVAAAVLLSATAVWAARILPLEKYDYNQKNAYFGVAIPVLTFIFVRNLSPLLRTRYLEPLHSLGKITLETYLMQHHVWLTSNAKTLLVVIPGYPKLNLVVVGCSYVFLSKELYRLTMSLRGMCLPDNLGACLRNLGGIAAALALALGVAAGLRLVDAGAVLCVCVTAALGFCAAVGVHLLLSPTREAGEMGASSAVVAGVGEGGSVSSGAGGRKEYDGRLLKVSYMGPIFVAVLAIASAASAWAPSPSTRDLGGDGPNDACAEVATHGMWQVNSGPCEDQDQRAAYCNSHEWKWTNVPDHCQLHYRPPTEVKKAFAGRHIVVAGDSVERYVYYSLIRSLGETTDMAHNTSIPKHADLPWESPDGSGTRISFLWAAKVDDLTKKVSSAYETMDFDVLLMGGGLWDALEVRDVDVYAKGIKGLRSVVSSGSSSSATDGLTMWVTLTQVVNDRLVDEEKKRWMTEGKLQKYRDAVVKSGLLSTVDGVVDGYELTDRQRGESYDGVHYTDMIYDAFAQVVVNLVSHFDRVAPPPSVKDSEANTIVDKRIRGMGNTWLGLMVLFLASVMVLTRDAFMGVPRLSLALFGGRYYEPESMTWERTYGDLLRKLGKDVDGTSSSGAVSSGGGASGTSSGVGSVTHRAVAGSRETLIEEAEALLLQETTENGLGSGVELRPAGFGARK